jgi:Lon protease-like protein
MRYVPAVTIEAATELTPADLAALPIFPLPGAALFPGSVLPLHVFEQRYRDMVGDVLADRKILAIARLKPGFEENYEGRPPVDEVCGAGVIVQHGRRDDGRYDILVRGLSRVRIEREHPPAARYRVVQATLLPDLAADPAVTSALEQRLGALWADLAPHFPDALRDLAELTRGAPNAGAVADRVAGALFADPELTQRLLTELDPSERLGLINEQLSELSNRLSSKPKSRLN